MRAELEAPLDAELRSAGWHVGSGRLAGAGSRIRPCGMALIGGNGATRRRGGSTPLASAGSRMLPQWAEY